jgi:hypothetical protein
MGEECTFYFHYLCEELLSIGLAPAILFPLMGKTLMLLVGGVCS